MANISGLERNVGRGFGYVAKNWLAKPLEAASKDPVKWVGITLVTSLVSKDAVNCYYYVKQSLNNEKIPEEKRKFVASLDLMNGLLNVVGQIGVYLLVEKAAKEKLFKKLFASKVNSDALKLHAQKIVQNAKEKLDVEKVHKALLKQHGPGSKELKALEAGFGAGLGFVVTAAFAKRIISPLVGTPLAGWFKRKYLDKPGDSKKDKDALKAATIQPKYNTQVDKVELSKQSKAQ